MSTMTHHDINRYLAALSATAVDGVFHYIYQKPGNNNNLTEMSYSNERWSREVFVGSAKSGSPAMYLVNPSADNQRMVFYLDGENVVNYYEYNEDDDEWTPGTLKADLKSVAHPKSKLTGVANNGTVSVYYQDNAGSLRELSRAPGSKSWQLSATLPATPAAGANLSAVTLNKTVSVYYQHPNSTVHQCTFENGNWNDVELENTSDGAPNGRMVALCLDGNNALLYLEGQAKDDKGNELYELKDGQRNVLGHIEDGVLKPSTAAECGFFGMQQQMGGGVCCIS